jgi:hypothetical protein
LFEENGRPLAELKQLIGALEPAITEEAIALAETWMAEGVVDDAIADETDAGHCAHMIANQALLETLGFEMVPPELEDPIRPLVEKRMASINAYYDRFDGIAEKVAQRIRDGGLGPDVAQRIRDGASLGLDPAFKALVDDVVLAGGGALSGNEFAVIKAMVTCKLTDGRRHE